VTPGLELRVTPSGVKSWSLRHRSADGKQFRRTLGTWPVLTADAARRAATQVEEQDNRDKPLTLEQLIEEYLERWARPKRMTHRESERVLKGEVLPWFGAHTLAQNIQRRDLARWIDFLAIERQLTAGVVRYYGHFRRCLRWAVEVDLLSADPSAGVRLPIREWPREKLITPDEVRALWNGLPQSPTVQYAVRVVLSTSLRIGEVLSAQWSNIGDGAWIVPATATKARRPHVVPLTPFLIALLAEVKAELLGEVFLFPSPQAPAREHLRSRTVSQGIRKWQPGLSGLRIHDVRRLVGTYLAQTGHSLEVVQGVLGHSPQGVTMRHYLAREALVPRMKDALVAWQDRLQQILDEGGV
jgi:integrase